MKRAHAIGLAALLLPASLLSAATFTVLNTADAGAGSLRQAILDANANPGADTIAFAIPGAGAQTIAPLTMLPIVTDTLTIDGYTQAGAAPNTLADGTNAVLTVVLDGVNIAGVLSGLVFNAPDCVVRGLQIVRFGGAGITLAAAASGSLVEGNFVGTDLAGTPGLGNGGEGVSVAGDLVTVGGTAPSARNLISGNGLNGVGIHQAVTGNAAIGNLIGTDASGTTAIGNGASGVFIDRASSNTIGGGSSPFRNVISGNAHHGVRILESGVLDGDANAVQGNFIGTDATGLQPLGNLQNGVSIESGDGNAIGGAADGAGNTIAFNGGDGVFVDPSATGNAILRNAIHDNGELGIDLFPIGPTPNDPGDGDAGANLGQNFPIVISGAPFGPNTRVHGVLRSSPSTTYRIEFFANPACLSRPQEFLEGGAYLGTTDATTDATGFVDFQVDLPVLIAPGERVTATATDPAGNTSEFSQRLPFSISPRSGPSGGATMVTVLGTDFDPNATLSIGFQTVLDAIVVDSTHITGTVPDLAPGTVNGVTITNPDESVGTLEMGWVSDFLDVDASHQFYSFVTTLVANGITVGVGGGNYGVNQATLRQQMAVFLLKGKHGLCYVPPACTGIFPDVPCPSTFADWIEALFAEGITGGCGGGNYCPTNPVRRDQMAVFLLKAEHGSSYVPPACAGSFADVACPSQFADWIERLAAESITGGCGGGDYCPSNSSTRGQMAVFIVKTFGLQ